MDPLVDQAVRQLPVWAPGIPDCLLRVDTVLTKLRVRDGRGSHELPTAGSIAGRLGGEFRRAAVGDLAGLGAGTLTVAWVQHPNDPQHVVLVHRRSGGRALVVVETQAGPGAYPDGEGVRRYTRFDPARRPGGLPDVPAVLRGPLLLPVDAHGRLLQVRTGPG